MRTLNVIMLGVMFLALPFASMGQAKKKKKADADTKAWRYEIEPVGTGTQGTYQVKVWSFSKNPKVATEQAKKNAVHGVVFKGFSSANGVTGQKPLARNPNVEQEKEDFFNHFFETGGNYQKFVTLTNSGAIGEGDRIKMKREYKIGVIVSVNVAGLRKDLEDAGIIKGLAGGF